MTLLELYESSKNLLMSGTSAASQVVVDNGLWVTDLKEILIKGAECARDSVDNISGNGFTLL